MGQWLITNGVQVATLLTLFVFIFKVSRWAGSMEARVFNLEGWLKSHVERHPGKTR